MRKNVVGIFISLMMIGFWFLPAVVLAESKSSSDDQVSIQDLQKKIEELTKQIQALQQKLRSVEGELGAPLAPVSVEKESPSGAPTPEATPPELTRTISRGSSGEDVRKLQEFLAKDKEIYPEGLITGFFGGLTEKALKRWQERHDIEAVGIVGPQTRARLQDISRGVIQGLMTQGAGSSRVIPLGLTIAPGIQKKFEDTATTSITLPIFIAPVPTTTIPATPAVSAVPAQPISQIGTTTVPATPATPAVPAQPGQTTVTSPPPPSLSPPPPPPAGTADTTSPSVPANFAALLTGDSNFYRVDMSWSKSTDTIGVTGYKLYKNGAQIWSQATSTSLVTLVYREYGSGSSGQSFAYTVAAYDAAGNISAQSSSVSVTISAVIGGASPPPPPPPPPPVTPPPPPPTSSISGYVPFGSAYSSSLVISNIQEHIGPTGKSWDGTLYATLYVTWTTNALATTQYSYKAPSPVGEQSGTQYVPVVTNHKTTIGLRSGSTYYYQLKATDASGNTAVSDSRTFVAPVLNTPAAIDTTLPIISNVKVQIVQISTGSFPYQATITWITDDLAHTGIFYTGTAYNTSGGMWDIHTPLTTSHTIVTDPLSANVKYEYTISSYNANAGETLYASNFTTPLPPVTPPPPPAPSLLAPTSVSIGWYKGFSGQPPIGTYQLVVSFLYTGNLADAKAFRLYLKKPGDSSFLTSVYVNPSSIDSTCNNYIYSGTWKMRNCTSSGGGYWQIFDPGGSSAAYPVGEYNAYVVATDSTYTLEGPVSSTAKNIVSKTTILSPVGAQSTLSPFFRWSIPSGWPGGSFWPQIDAGWSKAISSSIGSPEGTTGYDGPALDPSKTYYVNIWAEGTDSSGTRHFAMGDSNPSFTVSAATTTSFQDRVRALAQILDSLSRALETLRKTLK